MKNVVVVKKTYILACSKLQAMIGISRNAFVSLKLLLGNLALAGLLGDSSFVFLIFGNNP